VWQVLPHACEESPVSIITLCFFATLLLSQECGSLILSEHAGDCRTHHELRWFKEENGMSVDLAPGWKVVLDHGPDWLFIQLHGPFGETADATGLADSIDLLMEQDLVHRAVLELEELNDLPEDFLLEMSMLWDRISRKGGVVRLCGLNDELRELLGERDFMQRFTPYRNRDEAVLGLYRPNRPR
jgi:hypothetical protein